MFHLDSNHQSSQLPPKPVEIAKKPGRLDFIWKFFSNLFGNSQVQGIHPTSQEKKRGLFDRLISLIVGKSKTQKPLLNPFFPRELELITLKVSKGILDECESPSTRAKVGAKKFDWKNLSSKEKDTKVAGAVPKETAAIDLFKAAAKATEEAPQLIVPPQPQQAVEATPVVVVSEKVGQVFAEVAIDHTPPPSQQETKEKAQEKPELRSILKKNRRNEGGTPARKLNFNLAKNQERIFASDENEILDLINYLHSIDCISTPKPLHELPPHEQDLIYEVRAQKSIAFKEFLKAVLFQQSVASAIQDLREKGLVKSGTEYQKLTPAERDMVKKSLSDRFSVSEINTMLRAVVSSRMTTVYEADIRRMAEEVRNLEKMPDSAPANLEDQEEYLAAALPANFPNPLTQIIQKYLETPKIQKHSRVLLGGVHTYLFMWSEKASLDSIIGAYTKEIDMDDQPDELISVEFGDLSEEFRDNLVRRAEELRLTLLPQHIEEIVEQLAETPKNEQEKKFGILMYLVGRLYSGLGKNQSVSVSREEIETIVHEHEKKDLKEREAELKKFAQGHSNPEIERLMMLLNSKANLFSDLTPEEQYILEGIYLDERCRTYLTHLAYLGFVRKKSAGQSKEADRLIELYRSVKETLRAQFRSAESVRSAERVKAEAAERELKRKQAEAPPPSLDKSEELPKIKFDKLSYRSRLEYVKRALDEYVSGDKVKFIVNEINKINIRHKGIKKAVKVEPSNITEELVKQAEKILEIERREHEAALQQANADANKLKLEMERNKSDQSSPTNGFQW